MLRQTFEQSGKPVPDLVKDVGRIDPHNALVWNMFWVLCGSRVELNPIRVSEINDYIDRFGVAGCTDRSECISLIQSMDASFRMAMKEKND